MSHYALVMQIQNAAGYSAVCGSRVAAATWRELGTYFSELSEQLLEQFEASTTAKIGDGF